MTWDDADAFGRGLTKKLSDGHVYRLATEAEWEYSCRGGRPSSEPFGIGDGRTLTSRDANLNGTEGETVNAGSYAANALGLYDMHGNVWGWFATGMNPTPTKRSQTIFGSSGADSEWLEAVAITSPRRCAARRFGKEVRRIAGTAGWGSA